MSLFKELLFLFENLEKREKLTLIYGAYAVVIILGIIGLDFTLKRLSTLDEKIQNQTKNYVEIIELGEKYKQVLKNKKLDLNLSLSEIEQIATKTNIKNRITSIKPYQQTAVEVSFNNLSSDEIVNFIKNLKSKNIKVSSLTLEKTEKEQYKIRVVLER